MSCSIKKKPRKSLNRIGTVVTNKENTMNNNTNNNNKITKNGTKGKRKNKYFCVMAPMM